ncbi:hypothetical protein CONPUDRAFT_85466 [Coniophora puteana RWD-64-598 SS2]|uniref:Uncharacterized protein n=1 Tax=Coniophora puteana (strain RWD-64-598) TaxID=741705 RepID=A0A5M3M783_CONPW|nr:uncharacterized protein CONPUDRAFT_85466 [Coniophora puteana RWD-64-598 SS2]EIW75172.1 hypothetical protein CONPUDRAFT_85466 [Coniophora puteana RWD-64-598 SS2]
MSESELNESIKQTGFPESGWEEQFKAYDTAFDASMAANGEALPAQGRKPSSSEVFSDAVHYVRIEGVSGLVGYAIRFWDGGLQDEGQFCFDLFDLSAKHAVNTSRFGISFTVIPEVGKLTMAFSGPLRSWETNMGFTPEEIRAGEERFSILEDTLLSLEHPNSSQPFLFRSPKRDIPIGSQTVHCPVPWNELRNM